MPSVKLQIGEYWEATTAIHSIYSFIHILQQLTTYNFGVNSAVSLRGTYTHTSVPYLKYVASKPDLMKAALAFIIIHYRALNIFICSDFMQTCFDSWNFYLLIKSQKPTSAHNIIAKRWRRWSREEDKHIGCIMQEKRKLNRQKCKI